MTIKPWIVAIGVVAATVFGGCSTHLPAYPSMTDEEAITTIAIRQASITSISAECDLDLTDAAGQRISFDGVLVAMPPSRLRLRAWKFGHAVFDLTLVDGKAWMIAPEDQGGGHRFEKDAIPAKHLSEAVNILGDAFFRTATPAGGDSKTLLAKGTAFGREDMVCEIDRLTLTPLRFFAAGDAEGSAAQLLLGEYTVANETVWPMRVTLTSPSGEVLIRVRTVELNETLPSGAFTPPKRAIALP